MNTNGLCNRFEREGILRIERGLPLDSHFDTCAACEVARHKYDTLLAALPTSQPDASPPPGWQSRILRAAAESDAARPAFSTTGWGRPFAWAAVAAVGAVAAATFGLDPGPMQFEVQAETHAATTLADSPVEDLPTGDEQLTEAAPLPPPVAPRAAPKQAPPLTTAKASDTNAPSVAPKPAPSVSHLTQQAAKTDSVGQVPAQSRRLQVTRPDKLYGFALKYPRAAMKAKVQGETSVQCTIRADGRNTNCRILKSLPYIDSAVIRAVEAARSEPIKVNGKAVDHSDHVWHITITLREVTDTRTSARGLPNLNWDY
jgi:TonB family protein